MKIEVAGHTDSVGNATANESLSERRAKTVRNYLIRAGVNAANLPRSSGTTSP
ncbi:MAG: OmpA family protein [Acidimicrobiia bacterium]